MLGFKNALKRIGKAIDERNKVSEIESLIRKLCRMDPYAPIPAREQLYGFQCYDDPEKYLVKNQCVSIGGSLYVSQLFDLNLPDHALVIFAESPDIHINDAIVVFNNGFLKEGSWTETLKSKLVMALANATVAREKYEQKKAEDEANRLKQLS